MRLITGILWGHNWTVFGTETVGGEVVEGTFTGSSFPPQTLTNYLIAARIYRFSRASFWLIEAVGRSGSIWVGYVRGVR